MQFFDQTANKGFNGFLFDFTHKKLELIPRISYGRKRISSKVLEVGAGSGQHLKFVEKTYSKYTLTDINFSLMLENNRESKFAKIEYKVADVQNLPFKTGSFDRVISTCLLHHVNDVEKALLEIKRVTKKSDGLISIYLSCDPGILNRLLRSLLIIPKAKKLGFSEYNIFIAREHKNHFQSIDSMINHVFKGQNIHKKFYPFYVKSWNLNTFCIFQIQMISE